MMTEISYSDIFSVWEKHLWPNRVSVIEPISAMLYLQGYSTQNFSYTATYFGYYVNNELAGVNSGHKCSDGSYRSRGLYVFPKYRKQGIGVQLLIKTIDQGKIENSKFVWSLPRKESWNTYQKAGFNLSTEWHNTETGTNAYCRIDI